MPPPAIPSGDVPQTREHSRSLQDSGSVPALAAIAITVIVGLVLAFGLPWLQPSSRAGTALERYAPQNDGATVLFASYGSDGQLLGQRSANLRILPSARAITTDLRPTWRDALTRFYGARAPGTITADDLPDLLTRDGAQLYELRARDIGPLPGGEVTETLLIGLRSPDGDYQFGVSDLAHDKEVVYDPPLHVPVDIGSGQTWESGGTIGVASNVNYLVHSTVTQTVGNAQNSDCILITSVVTITATAAGQPPYLNVSAARETYCAGDGLLDSRQYTSTDTTLAPASSTVRLSDNTGRRPAVVQPAHAPDLSILAASTDVTATTTTNVNPATWKLTRAGQMQLSGDTSASAIPPVYIASQPPLVLVASTGGDLAAFDVAGGAVAWRFHTAGPVYSPPAYDPRRGQIYFGAGDKNLYALDTRGFFIWSFRTSDNIASRPLVISDTVIFGSEDRTVYALDAETGALRWKAVIDGAVVSSPASADADRLAIVGSDNGSVTALDIATGDARWDYHAGGAVEAPIAVVNGVAYVASRDRSLAALDATTGKQLWATDLGATLRTAPAIGTDRAYIVDGLYRLNALALADGHVLWSSESLYVGAPLLVGDHVVVARYDGQVDLIDAAGARVMTWQYVPTANSRRTFSLGPTSGGGSVWLADDSTVLWRLGSPSADAARQVQLKSAWSVNLLYDAPFKAAPFLIPPAPVDDRAVLVDRSANIYLTDPLTGKSSVLGEVATSDNTPIIDSIVASDTLVSSIIGSLYANSLRDGRALWSFTGDGTLVRPPAANDDTVVFMTQHPSKNTEITGTLYALGLHDGAPRWQVPLGGFFVAGGPVIRGNVAYLSTPPAAYDLATGARLWQASLDGPGAQSRGPGMRALGVGTPALDQAGATLYAAIINEPPSGSGGTGEVVALDAHTGALRWQTDLAADTLNYFGQVWLSGKLVIVPVGDPSGRVIALDAATGAVAWRYQPPTPRYGQITVVAGRVWMILQNGHVLVLDAEGGKLIGQYDEFQLDLALLRTIAQRPYVRVDSTGTHAIVALDTRLIGLEVTEEEGVQP